MRNNVWSARIPNLLAVVLLIVGIFGISFLSTQGVIYEGRANAGAEPKGVRISNISDTSVTVSYITDNPVVGSISYGTTPETGTAAFDDREKDTAIPIPHVVHYISLTNLTPNTLYYFKILSGGAEFKNGKELYTIKTANTTTAARSGNFPPLQGKITRADGSSPLESMVYITGDNMQTLSALGMPDGRYTLPIDSARTKSLDEFLTLQQDTLLQILALTTTERTTAKIFPLQTGELPIMTLSKNYDFTSEFIQTSENASVSAEILFPSFPAFESDSDEQAIGITTPADNAGLTDTKPMFRGSALPNESVEITIESDPITASVKANSNGQWQFRPSSELPPGKHTITIKTKNEAGILTTIRQSFTVFAEGSQFTDPSITPTLTTSPIPTNTFTPTPTATHTPTPTFVVQTSSPTITQIEIPTPTPTFTPTPTLINGNLSPTTVITRPPLPKSGSTALIATGILSISASVIGMLLFIMTRGGTPLR